MLSDISDRVQSTQEFLAALQTAVPGNRVDRADEVRVSPEDGFDTRVLREVIGDWSETSLEDGIHRTANLYREIAARTGGKG